MERFREQSKFEIQPTIEQRPFESPAVQFFFNKWCEINDSIKPQFLDRKQWDGRGMQGILEKRPDGKQTLFIPEDLQLWEMVGVMEVVDRDTFATKSEKRMQAKEKILALGKTFENAGVYIANRLDKIEGGREIAEGLALEFYQYGQSLIQGKAQEIFQIDELAKHNLTPGETEDIDHFLAGDSLYELRKQRTEKLISGDPAKKDEFYEVERQKTLTQFFRAAQKAFVLKSENVDAGLQNNLTKLKPWQDNISVHGVFLKRIDRALTKQVETPKREFEMSIFRRGLEKLTSEMRERGWKHSINSFFEKMGFNLRLEQRKLFEVLNIPQLRTDLEAIIQQGDTARIALKEREIADKIQKAVSNFPFQNNANNPSEMVVNQYINCVGASTLGGALLKEAGLNYLVGDVPSHSILFLVTSDGQVEWRDMLNSSYNEHLTDEMIKGQKKDGKPLTVSDIVAFSHKPSSEGLMFDIDSPKYRKKLHWVKEDEHQYVTVFEPEYGQQIQILNNTGVALADLGHKEEAIEAYRQSISVDSKFSYPYNGLGNALVDLGRKEEAIEAYRQAISVDPKYSFPYYGLGNALAELGHKEEAIEAYRQAISVDPKYSPPYNGLGNTLADLGRKEEAIEAYRQAISIDPKSSYPYNGLGNALVDLGRKEEAIEAYQKFIDLADKNSDDYWIERAKRIIEELKS